MNDTHADWITRINRMQGAPEDQFIASRVRAVDIVGSFLFGAANHG
jgi:hypothetical protein